MGHIQLSDMKLQDQTRKCSPVRTSPFAFPDEAHLHLATQIFEPSDVLFQAPSISLVCGPEPTTVFGSMGLNCKGNDDGRTFTSELFIAIE